MNNQPADSKKDLILKTARELLARHGFAKTTLDDIANALGMKKSSLYYYYDNKDALLEDVMQKEEEKYCSMVISSLSGSGKTIDKLIRYEKAKFRYIHETFKMNEVNTNILFELKSKMYSQITRLRKVEYDNIKKILDEGIKNGELKKCDTGRVTELLQTISEGLRHREFYLSTFTMMKEISFDRAVEEMTFAVKLILNGLSVKADADAK